MRNLVVALDNLGQFGCPLGLRFDTNPSRGRRGGSWYELLSSRMEEEEEGGSRRSIQPSYRTLEVHRFRFIVTRTSCIV